MFEFATAINIICMMDLNNVFGFICKGFRPDLSAQVYLLGCPRITVVQLNLDSIAFWDLVYGWGKFWICFVLSRQILTRNKGP
jgi:hypothetical protein